MTEHDNNRRWLIESHLNGQSPVASLDGAHQLETLLYYRSQLEAELDHVQRVLATLLADPALQPATR